MFRGLLSANLFRSIHQQQTRNMKVVVDRVLSDNYMYYLIDTATKEALVIDLGDASRISEIEKREKIKIKGALITHHHWDHSAGSTDFLKQYPGAKLYGGDKERIPDLTDVVIHNQVIKFNDMQIECISTPG